MSKLLAKYNWFECTIKWQLVTSGFWPNDQKTPKSLKILLRICAACLFNVFLVSAFFFSFHFGNNMNLLIKGMCFIFGISVILSKFWTLWFYQNDLKIFKERITSNFKRHLADIGNHSELLHYFPVISKLYYYYYASSYMVNFIVSFTTLLNHVPGNNLRVYPIYFNYNYAPGGVIDLILFAGEVIGTFFILQISLGFEGYFIVKSIHLTGEMRLLSNDFKTLKTSENYRKDLKEFVDRHVELIEAQHLLENVYGSSTIWLSVTSAVSLCMIVFQTRKILNTGMWSIYIVHYCSIKLLQTFLYAYFGSVIADENRACIESVYEVYWPENNDMRMMKDFLIIMSQSPQPFMVKGLLTIDMSLFSKVVITAVSYFFMLKTLEEIYF